EIRDINIPIMYPNMARKGKILAIVVGTCSGMQYQSNDSKTCKQLIEKSALLINSPSESAFRRFCYDSS
ncbi:MAG: hypothetical protein CUN57_04060, partial [Phototrophicales bacterium]